MRHVVRTSGFVFAIILGVMLRPAAAQAPSIQAEMLKDWASLKDTITKIANEMPADKYGFKPTPAQMSFGDVIVHLSEGNDYLCSTVAGTTAAKRSEVKVDAGKEKLVARLRETFQSCDSALAKLDDSGLSRMVPWFGNRQVTRAQAVLATAQDWADHYSQLAIYLRLNGLLPPTAKQKEE